MCAADFERPRHGARPVPRGASCPLCCSLDKAHNDVGPKGPVGSVDRPTSGRSTADGMNLYHARPVGVTLVSNPIRVGGALW